jgi:cyclophilin family peptidyl-prolyl cis-trans isomerase
LDYKNKSPYGWGYCVFGRVVSGMDVVKNIENSPTGMKDGVPDVPTTPIVMSKVSVFNSAQAAKAAPQKTAIAADTAQKK